MEFLCLQEVTFLLFSYQWLLILRDCWEKSAGLAYIDNPEQIPISDARHMLHVNSCTVFNTLANIYSKCALRLELVI